jgi:hypothetical protein
MRHSAVQQLFYDFLHNELDDTDRRTVEQHLATCKRCSDELDELQKALAILPRPASQPDSDMGEEFWRSLSTRIERQLRLQRVPRRRTGAALLDRVRWLVTLRPAYAYTFGGALATLVVAILFFRSQPDPPVRIADREDVPVQTQILPTATESQQRISDYFHKSKVLLVGIANLKTDDEQQIDLSTEKSLSRNLVQEARLLQQQPLDGRSARLMRDLEKIMIELANLEEANDLPNVELIRSGIHQENLLFKIRMAAASYDTNQLATSERVY